MSEQKLLEFAARFSQTDLGSLREGDWLNLKEDLGEFLTPFFGFTNLNPLKVSRAEVTSAQNAARSTFENIILLRNGEKSDFVDGRPVTIYPTYRRLSGLAFSCKKFEDAFLFRLLFVLMASPQQERILSCKADDCNRIFYRTHKQKYCSPTCQTREFMRNWRMKNKDKESERNHRKYEKRMKKKLGQKTRVARRPRRASHARNL
jgi:hypothetical protein